MQFGLNRGLLYIWIYVLYFQTRFVIQLAWKEIISDFPIEWFAHCLTLSFYILSRHILSCFNLLFPNTCLSCLALVFPSFSFFLKGNGECFRSELYSWNVSAMCRIRVKKLCICIRVNFITQSFKSCQAVGRFIISHTYNAYWLDNKMLGGASHDISMSKNLLAFLPLKNPT